MLESDLRTLFERQAATEPPPAPISIPAALRIGRRRLRRRRAGTLGSPVLAAVAVAAVLLAGPFASSHAGRPRPPANRPAAPPAAPRWHFNPLVPYAAADWSPYRVTTVLGYSFPTALRLIDLPASASSNYWTSIAVYAAGQCFLAASHQHLWCGSVAASTSAVLNVSGPAPDVRGHVAYWIQGAHGDLTPDIPSGEMVAFEYGPNRWAMVINTGTPADVLRIAASLRYGQTSPLRFPIRLTSLPSSWREVQEVDFTESGSQQDRALVLGRYPASRTSLPPDSLTLNVGIPTGSGLPCTRNCRVTLINGYSVELMNVPAYRGLAAFSRLTTGNADGLALEIDIPASGVPLSPAEVFAHHLILLGPDPADWTTKPIS